MTSVRLWFARLVMLYAAAIFCFLGYLYLLRPLSGIAKFGVAVSGAPESIAFLRTSLGAMFASMAITAIYGLVRPNYFRTCLIFLILMDGCIVAARLFGMVSEGVTPVQIGELQTEGWSLLAFVVALWVCPRSIRAATGWPR